MPSDLYIGEVTKVENDEYGLAKEVRVKTGANLSDIQHVYIAKKVITRISMKERLDNESVRLYNDRYHRFYLDTLIGYSFSYRQPNIYLSSSFNSNVFIIYQFIDHLWSHYY